MIGDIITVKGVKCVVLDEINGNPFVIAELNKRLKV